MTTGNLDTRKKIVSRAQAGMQVCQGNWLVVAGYFDPLTAPLAGRLRDLIQDGRDERVLAVVLDDNQALLPSEARSVSVAALRMVHAVVVMSEEELNGFVPSREGVRFVFDSEAERRISDQFAALVLDKQRLQLGSSDFGS
ncbi:MAG: hypothetical protein ACJ746_24240 [Bryobacteraceae bacterium]